MALIAGSYPPQVCGVGDYTERLSIALQANGIEVRVLTGDRWGLFDTLHLQQRVSEADPDIIHLQYPTVGYGAGLAPQALVALSRKVPIVVTLHEFSQAHILRRIASIPLALGARRLVFTTDHELQSVASWLPQIQARTSIINIGSNIPFRGNERKKDPREVVYFGLIRPNKGLEEFLQLAEMATSVRRPYRFTVIGTPDPRFQEYFGTLEAQASELPVTWELGLSAVEVAERLGRASYAFLPFPDGASERRGSLLAALGNGVVALTTTGPQTPTEMLQVISPANTAGQALEQLDELATNSDRRRVLAEAASLYARRFSWDRIAHQHLELYQQVLTGEGH